MGSDVISDSTFQNLLFHAIYMVAFGSTTRILLFCSLEEKHHAVPEDIPWHFSHTHSET